MTAARGVRGVMEWRGVIEKKLKGVLLKSG